MLRVTVPKRWHDKSFAGAVAHVQHDGMTHIFVSRGDIGPWDGDRRSTFWVSLRYGDVALVDIRIIDEGEGAELHRQLNGYIESGRIEPEWVIDAALRFRETNPILAWLEQAMHLGRRRAEEDRE